MKIMLTGLVAFCAMWTVACAGTSSFPPQVMDKVSPTFDFDTWKDASPDTATGKSASGHMVQLGGRILQANNSSKGILIVAEQLPIVNHPVYGPKESAKRSGDYEFALQYPEELPPGALRFGNRFIVVGKTNGRTNVVVDGAPKTKPLLVADCIHVWETGNAGIESFKETLGGGFSPLPEQTYCTKKK